MCLHVCVYACVHVCVSRQGLSGSPDCPVTHSVHQASLKHRNPHASVSGVLGLKVLPPLPGSTYIFFNEAKEIA